MTQLTSSKIARLEQSNLFNGVVGVNDSFPAHIDVAPGDRNPRTGLRAVILLGGSVRKAGFRAEVGRSLLDLPLTSNRTVMDLWLAEIANFRRNAGPVVARLILDEQTVSPSSVPQGSDHTLTIERDPQSFRGTGGLLSDLARAYQFEGWLLVVNAAQVLRVTLEDLYARLLAAPGGVRLIAQDGGRVGGVMLVKCDTLRHVPEIGYCDFKEQVLKSLRDQGRTIGVAKLERPSSFPLRKRSQYLDAVAVEHGSIVGDDVGLNQSAEDWKSRFAIIEQGAVVSPSVLVHDSVVLSGARVGSRAAIIRSVLGPKAVVAAGRVIRDSVVS